MMPEIYCSVVYGKRFDSTSLSHLFPHIVHSSFVENQESTSSEMQFISWLGRSTENQRKIVYLLPLFRQIANLCTKLFARFHHRIPNLLVKFHHKLQIPLMLQLITGFDGEIGLFFGLQLGHSSLVEEWSVKAFAFPTLYQKFCIRTLFRKYGLGHPKNLLIQSFE